MLLRFPRKGTGALLRTLDGVETERPTLMCAHCQYTWVVQPGSGRRRGFCRNCMGPTCGRRDCELLCVPWEQAMERLEGGGE